MKNSEVQKKSREAGPALIFALLAVAAVFSWVAGDLAGYLIITNAPKFIQGVERKQVVDLAQHVSNTVYVMVMVMNVFLMIIHARLSRAFA